MSPRPLTQVVLLTPEGRGAVASLLVEGPLALQVVGELFHPASRRSLAEEPCGKIVFGRWQSPEVGEELVVCRRDTGIEIHCHGGRAAAAAISASLTERGCRTVPWRQWMAESTRDPIEAAAQIALADATTERTAAILWDQSTGALRRALDAIAAQLDAGQPEQARCGVDTLLDYSALGRHLVTPWQVVLAGRPNVGKSSLINALLGYRRAIVHDTPGTTRDVVTAATAVDGWPVQLADTAGLHVSADPLEASGIRLTQNSLAAADLAVLVFDAGMNWSADDEGLASSWPEALRVFNKCDLLTANTTPGTRPPGLYVSALRGEGIHEMEREIATRLVPQVPARGAAVPFTATQVRSLEQIRAALAARDPATARQLLARAESWGDAC
ncbi:MAG: 50S ribosome-binding GTPase [Planctomycetia bacterium]|nr:50S ribosome-binding GTPase [Planctomycetia bacterium]